MKDNFADIVAMNALLRCDGKKYIREEKLVELLGESVAGIKLDPELVEWLRAVLIESEGERKTYVQDNIAKLQKRYTGIQNALDSAYEDRLRDVISEELFVRKRKVWEDEMARTTPSTA